MADQPEKRLIVCADDFGMSAGVNEGIIRAHREGILTDASLMAGGAAFEDAVALARENPGLSVGLHLVLVQGRAVATPERIPALVAEEGRFGDNPVTSGLRYFFAPGIRGQLRFEIAAQIEKCRSAGLSLSHVNGHLSIHMHPTVVGIIVELARRYGIRAIRLTREPLLPALRFNPRHAVRKTAEAMIFHLLARRAERRFADVGIRHPDRMYGLHQTGQVSEAYLLDLLPRLESGVTEVYCHPGMWDSEARRWRPPDYEPAVELAALLSPHVRSRIGELGIRLTTYRELA